MKQGNGITARQMKAARALLDWSQDRLSQACGLSIATIRKLEAGNISPRQSTMKGIQKAFENSGLEFLEPNGVRQKIEEITIYEGEKGIRNFYDNIYDTVSKCGGEVMNVCRDANTVFKCVLKEYRHEHIAKMLALKDRVTIKVILTESRTSTPAAELAEYRYLSNGLVNSVPFYVYGDKCALRLLNNETSPRFLVIQSHELAETLCQQFYSMWDKAVVVSAPPHLQEKETQKKKKK